jgi:hypothetical protein
MSSSESQPESVYRRAEVVRLADLSRELKVRLDAIERRIEELRASIAARASESEMPGDEA